jgi:hypothetical protein
MKRTVNFLLIGIFFLTACGGGSAPATQPALPPAIQTAAATTTPLPTFTPTVTATSTSVLPTLTPSITPTSTPDTREIPYQWRKWPVVPTLSPNAMQILRATLSNPALDIHTFSKVGDCQMTSGTFLGGYATGKYAIPAGLDPTVAWFTTSMTEESITAANGLGINSILNPLFGLAAGYTQCGNNETPLDCELRTKRPAVVLIAMGTNWKPGGEISFDKYLRVVVDRVLATGALPILATKADNIEQDWKLNQVTAQVAYDYDLPLVNVWRSVQALPNHGLKAPENVYLLPDGWLVRNEAWLKTLDQVRQVLEAGSG